MGLSEVRRGAASPVLTYDFMKTRTFRASPCGQRKEQGLTTAVTMETHHFH